MSRQWIAILCAAVLAGVAGCGGGGGSGGSDGKATLNGQLSADPAAGRVAAEALSGPVDVTAVDETGAKADEALGVTDEFVLVVPTGHEYVLIFADAQGIIGAMVYGEPGQERPDFAIDQGTISLDLGEIVVNPSKRSVHTKSSGQFKRPGTEPGEDSDHDGIPDDLDEDDDNDGIHNANDEWKKDHDNDGIADDQDTDDDNDGIADQDDEYPMDVDNDGEDDDRDQCDKRADRGAQLWADNGCGSCHGEDGSGGEESIRGVNVNEIVHALKKGEGEPGGDEYMPAFPQLVRFGTDFRAFLGCNGDADDGVCLDGNAANGQDVFETNCAVCHSAAVVGDEDAEEIAEVLANGEGEMAAMPPFVDDAADIAAYLAGCPTDGSSEPVDMDGDGVADDVDQCPGTPAGTVVNSAGCPDEDGDGVADADDVCPGTPIDTTVDATGCEVVVDQDLDGDGVLGSADLCPAAAGPASNAGCPRTPEEIFAGGCNTCHALPKLGDTSGSDLTSSTRVNEMFGGGTSHNGFTLTADEITALATYLALP